MENSSQYKPGKWLVICDRCANKVYSDEIIKEWTGLLVCKSCHEPRHPQDFMRARADKIAVPFSRPQPEDQFQEINYILPLSCTPMTSLGEANRGTADCAQADRRLMNDIVD